ncbi:hypothetical protein DRN62_01820 [Nanoarchaeota archaeon]|nr:MAG: hypothetical protein DRN62_01820 [Nanoarchaeota archaeon]
MPKPDINTILKRIEELEKKTQILEHFEEAINKLNEQIEKMVTISINLQAKMTELMIKMTDLVEGVNEMVGLLKEASEVELEQLKEAGVTLNVGPLIEEVKKLQEQNKEMVKALKGLEGYFKKMYTRELITKAVKGYEEGYVL